MSDNKTHATASIAVDAGDLAELKTKVDELSCALTSAQKIIGEISGMEIGVTIRPS
ncbi:hypothetical protein [uncultured Senegalimassilia sp.]|jgi:hypothetical protein|uniref:hypothetical protein n=1 Tax=uncultured Senegalimassilia sp. TaxID=1714350 RepID=UPI0025D531FE|nr:hypothetical protein [uncultured Senegalimassilia sp.]